MFMKRQRALRARRELLPLLAEIVRDVEIDVPVAVVVAERAAGAPSRVGGLSAVGKRAAPGVVPEDARAERRDVDVREAVVVVVGDARAHAPAPAHEAAAGCDVRESAAALISIERDHLIAAVLQALQRRAVDDERRRGRRRGRSRRTPAPLPVESMR